MKCHVFISDVIGVYYKYNDRRDSNNRVVLDSAESIQLANGRRTIRNKIA